MKSSWKSRITGEHGAASQEVLEGLLAASRRPEHAFEIVERMAQVHPSVERALLRASNAAARRGYQKVTTVRGALVRLGMVQASRVILEDAHRTSPTVIHTGALVPSERRPGERRPGERRPGERRGMLRRAA